jgi:peptidoglycan hydrolase-like protein with peptidoglycan-binding domain
MTPTTPGAKGNPCPPGQALEGGTCAPSRVQGNQSSQPRMDRSMDKMDRQVGAERGVDKRQVKSMQEALKEKGYDPGAIDGAMGPRTSSALREFQQAEGLRATGRLDAETRSKLGI